MLQIPRRYHDESDVSGGFRPDRRCADVGRGAFHRTNRIRRLNLLEVSAMLGDRETANRIAAGLDAQDWRFPERADDRR